MRKSLVLATLVVLVCSAAAFAGVPDPSRSGCALNTQPLACQWRFRNDGGLDKLTLKLTLRDAFDSPVASCSTYCNLAGASLVAKNCGGDRKGGLSTAGGVVNFVYRCIGGRGTVQLRVTAICSGNIGICSKTITFTNPDLSGSRDSDNGAVNVVDLGIWAGGISPYGVSSDFNCDAAVNVIDLGILAGGIGKTCANCP
ncbi:MAG: hypothetical protein U0167_02350 [bacterium]